MKIIHVVRGLKLWRTHAHTHTQQQQQQQQKHDDVISVFEFFAVVWLRIPFF